MANISGQAGVNLSTELANYLSTQQGTLTSEQITNIVNGYLTGGDKLASQGGSVTTGIYKRFGEFDQVTGKVEVVTTGLWSGDTGSLESFFTSSTQIGSNSGNYYYNVYQSNPSSSLSEVQFAVAYGNRLGSGSVSLSTSDDALLSSKATYSQYRSILLNQDDKFFTFLSASTAGTHDSDDIYVVNIARSRYKETMDPGNWELTLSGSTGTATFIDDSGKKFSDTAGRAGRVFSIVQGTLNLGTENEATIINTTAPVNGQGYGLFYPDQGLMVFNPSAIAEIVGNELDPVLNSTNGIDLEYKNQQYLVDSIITGGDFEARRTENISTAHYFVRATNREFNFSNNPTFVTGSDGTFRESTFIRDPKTYITTVGLYSPENELLAVAKTSQPIAKSFDREILIKIKLDF